MCVFLLVSWKMAWKKRKRLDAIKMEISHFSPFFILFILSLSKYISKNREEKRLNFFFLWFDIICCDNFYNTQVLNKQHWMETKFFWKEISLNSKLVIGFRPFLNEWAKNMRENQPKSSLNLRVIKILRLLFAMIIIVGRSSLRLLIKKIKLG